jgi:hypothetical protein
MRTKGAMRVTRPGESEFPSPAPYSFPTNVNNVTSGGHANRTGV